MEQITVTKEELLEIVEKAVSKRLDGVKEKSAKTIFKEVIISQEDIKLINNKFNIPTPITYQRNGVDTEELLNISKIGQFTHVNSNTHHRFVVHDNLRLMSQRIVGASRNTDIDKDDYEFVEECYLELKEKFLELYERSLDRKLNKKTAS